MERIRRGDIWTVELVARLKLQPALVVSIDAINDLLPDVLLIPITSQPGPLRVRLSADATRTGLRLESFAKCESLGPVHKSRLKQRIGEVPTEAWRSIEAGIKRVLGLDEIAFDR